MIDSNAILQQPLVNARTMEALQTGRRLYRWNMFTEINNHLYTEVAYKCTKSETQQILEAVIMLLIILQHHTLHTKLSLVGTHFGFFIFRNKKIRATRPG